MMDGDALVLPEKVVLAVGLGESVRDVVAVGDAELVLDALALPLAVGDSVKLLLGEGDEDEELVPLALPLGVAVRVGAPDKDGEPELVAVGNVLLLVDGDALGVRDEAADGDGVRVAESERGEFESVAVKDARALGLARELELADGDVALCDGVADDEGDVAVRDGDGDAELVGVAEELVEGALDGDEDDDGNGVPVAAGVALVDELTELLPLASPVADGEPDALPLALGDPVIAGEPVALLVARGEPVAAGDALADGVTAPDGLGPALLLPLALAPALALALPLPLPLPERVRLPVGVALAVGEARAEKVADADHPPRGARVGV